MWDTLCRTRHTYHTWLNVSSPSLWKMSLSVWMPLLLFCHMPESHPTPALTVKRCLHVCVLSYPCSLNWVLEAFFSTLTHVMLPWIATPGIKPSESLSTLEGIQLQVRLYVSIYYFFSEKQMKLYYCCGSGYSRRCSCYICTLVA